jgi:hypothetical protein
MYLNAELHRRCLCMADATTLNYWGPAVPAVVLLTVGIFWGAVTLADPSLHFAPLMVSVYVAYVWLNAGRLGAGAPLSPALHLQRRAAPILVYGARLGAAVWPMCVEILLFCPLLLLARPWPGPALSLLLSVLLGALASAAIGLYFAARLLHAGLACRATYAAVALIGSSAWSLQDVIASHAGVGLYFLALGLTPVIADTVGRLCFLERAPGPSTVPGCVSSWRMGLAAAVQSALWGFQPWSRYRLLDKLREWWYTIGLCSVLLIGVVHCCALTWVSLRDARAGPATITAWHHQTP